MLSLSSVGRFHFILALGVVFGPFLLFLLKTVLYILPHMQPWKFIHLLNYYKHYVLTDIALSEAVALDVFKCTISLEIVSLFVCLFVDACKAYIKLASVIVCIRPNNA